MEKRTHTVGKVRIPISQVLQYNGFSRILQGTNFEDFPHSMSLAVFSCYVKLMRKNMHFSCDEVYHRMGIVWGKTTHAMGKV